MTRVFTATAADQAILQDLVEAEVRRQLNKPQRPPTEHAWAEGEDHQAPEVYVARKTETLDTSTGTGTAGPALPAEEEVPDSADATFYRLFGEKDGIVPGEMHQLPGLTRQVHAPIGSIPNNEFFVVMRTKHGEWVVIQGLGVVRVCFAVDHPGYGIEFTAYLGAWSSAAHEWYYGDNAGAATVVNVIDWWFSENGPDPEKGATALAIPKPSDQFGTIYELFPGDCDSPGPCFPSTGTGS